MLVTLNALWFLAKGKEYVFHRSMYRLGILCVANIHTTQNYQGDSGVQRTL